MSGIVAIAPRNRSPIRAGAHPSSARFADERRPFPLTGQAKAGRSMFAASRKQADVPARGPLVSSLSPRRTSLGKDVAQTRPDLLPACLWLLVRRPATRLAVGAYSPKPEELAELGQLAKP